MTIYFVCLSNEIKFLFVVRFAFLICLLLGYCKDQEVYLIFYFIAKDYEYLSLVCWVKLINGYMALASNFTLIQARIITFDVYHYAIIR